MNRRDRAIDVLAVAALVRLAAPWVAPGAQPADAGELQLVARHLGVAHPPGYPLYTLSAHAFGRVAAHPLAAHLLGVPCADAGLDGATCAGWALWPWAISAFSALLAATTLLVVFHAGRRLGGGAAAGLAGAAALAAAPTFVAQATVAGIRMPTALLTAIVLALALRWLDATARPDAARAPRTGNALLAGLALAFALAAGHHPSLAFLVLPLAAVVLARRPGVVRDRRAIATVAGAALLGLLPLAYLPLRAGALLAPPDIGTLGGAWYHATAAGFRGDVLYFDDPRTLIDRLAVLADLLALQLGPLGLALAAAGALWLAARRPLHGALLVGSAGIIAALSITYRAPQTVEYLLPAYVALALLVAAGAAAVLSGARRLTREGQPAPATPRHRLAVLAQAALAAVLVALPLWRGRGVPAAVALSAPRLADPLARTLGCLGADGRALAGWHYATPLWVAALARDEGATRLPEAIAYVAPDFDTGDPIGVTWRKRAAALEGRQLLVVTNRPAELAAEALLLPVHDTPFYALARAAERRAGASEPSRAAAGAGGATCTGPPTAVLARPSPLAVLKLPGGAADRGDASVRLAHAHLGPPEPDGSREVTLWFAPGDPRLDEPLTAVVQLVDGATGAVHGQWDRPIPAAWTTAAGPSVRAALVPFHGAPRAVLEVRAGVYRAAPRGPERLVATAPGDPEPEGLVATAPGGPIDAVAIGTADLSAAALPPPLDPDAIPFGAAMALSRWRVREAAGQMIVDLTWRAGLVGRWDLTASVHASGDGWSRQHDGTPALGALPTLKWLPGWRVRDRHRIDLTGAGPPREVSVGVYDAFSLEPLPVTDAERVREGQGQRAVIWRAGDP